MLITCHGVTTISQKKLDQIRAIWGLPYRGVMPARQADGRGTHVAGGQIVSTTYVPEHTHCHTHTTYGGIVF